MSSTSLPVIGGILRNIRTRKGLTLRETAERSAGLFKPSVLAAYERGERSISLERFRALATVYDVPADRLLAEMVRMIDGRPPDVVDVERIADLTGPAARAMHLFAERVMRLRGFRGNEVAIRSGDLQVLSASLGMSEQELRSELAAALTGFEQRPR